MDLQLFLLIIVVITALAFDFTNGFHDTGNAMATSIASGALKPKIAVALSASLNLVGAFLSTAVAATIAKGLVDSGLVTLELVFAGLVGGIVWNLLTWLLGIPSSSSHALIGGIVGAMIAAVGAHGVIWKGVVSTVMIPAVVSPVIAGLVVGAVGTWLVYRITRGVPEERTEAGFRRGQIGSASLVSLAHGTNDAQKTMGIIFLALISYGAASKTDAMPPFWVILSCALAIALGHLPRRLARSSAPWARAWSRSSRRRAWPPNHLRPPSSCCPATSATRCPPRTSRPARSWAAASASPAPRCAGASPAGWRPPG